MIYLLQKVTTPKPDRNCTATCSILEADIFAACRQVVDFSPFVRSCEYDACSGTDSWGLLINHFITTSNFKEIPIESLIKMNRTFSPEQSCYTIATAAQECMAVGICVDWRKFAAECPFDCADEKIYMPCEDTCDTTAKTCDDLLGKDEITPAGACQYRETCGCPQGTVEFNQTCIEASECPICNGKYKEGEKWENPDDPCEVYECKNGEIKEATIQCEYEKSECSELGMRKVIVSSNETCCQQSECVCLPALCPEKVEKDRIDIVLNCILQPLCGEHEDLHILPGHESKCCPEYYCRAKECDVQVYQDFLQVEDCVSKIKVIISKFILIL